MIPFLPYIEFVTHFQIWSHIMTSNYATSDHSNYFHIFTMPPTWLVANCYLQTLDNGMNSFARSCSFSLSSWPSWYFCKLVKYKKGRFRDRITEVEWQHMWDWKCLLSISTTFIVCVAVIQLFESPGPQGGYRSKQSKQQFYDWFVMQLYAARERNGVWGAVSWKD